MSMFDDEWDEALNDLSDDELVEYIVRVYETISKDPESFPEVTPEMLDHMRDVAEKFETSIETAKAADKQAKIAEAELNKTADAILLTMSNDDNAKGH